MAGPGGGRSSGRPFQPGPSSLNAPAWVPPRGCVQTRITGTRWHVTRRLKEAQRHSGRVPVGPHHGAYCPARKLESRRGGPCQCKHTPAAAAPGVCWRALEWLPRQQGRGLCGAARGGAPGPVPGAGQPLRAGSAWRGGRRGCLSAGLSRRVEIPRRRARAAGCELASASVHTKEL
jgi:hypothetical protein